MTPSTSFEATAQSVVPLRTLFQDGDIANASGVIIEIWGDGEFGSEFFLATARHCVASKKGAAVQTISVILNLKDGSGQHPIAIEKPIMPWTEGDGIELFDITKHVDGLVPHSINHTRMRRFSPGLLEDQLAPEIVPPLEVLLLGYPDFGDKYDRPQFTTSGSISSEPFPKKGVDVDVVAANVASDDGYSGGAYIHDQPSVGFVLLGIHLGYLSRKSGGHSGHAYMAPSVEIRNWLVSEQYIGSDGVRIPVRDRK